MRETRDRICQPVYENGQLASVLVWCEAAWHLKDRDETVGWAVEREQGYRPLLDESFSDPESHAATVYKATNWTQAGTTKGFSRDHTDCYLSNGRPKRPDARTFELMYARELPEA